MARQLEVWLFRNHVGTLTSLEGRLSFWYDPAWLTHPDAMALSYSLPLQSQPFSDRATRPFFAGLLPDGHIRNLIAQQQQVSQQ
ncbi:MAG: HipA N-terminal protein [Gammaproteobacteria bacterium]|nr:HipA N-terminal protein [Gammaproteobacteria bacterium]